MSEYEPSMKDIANSAKFVSTVAKETFKPVKEPLKRALIKRIEKMLGKK